MHTTEDGALLQTILDTASNGIAVLQPDLGADATTATFTIAMLNAKMASWTTTKEYVGKPFAAVFPIASDPAFLNRLTETLQTGIAAVFESRKTDGENERWFWLTATRQSGLLIVAAEELTEQKNTELLLEEAERRKRLNESITNNTPDLVYAFDLNYKFTYANKALLDMWGKTAEDSIGRGLRENGYEEWHALMHENEIDQIVATKKSVRGTVSFPHAELGKRIYDYILVPVLDEQGEVEAIAGTTRDITEIKSAEEGLMLTQNRLRSMIDQTPAPTLVLLGDDLVVDQINQSMLRMIGQTEAIVGKPFINFLPELTGQYIWEQVLKVYREGIPFDQAEVCVAHKRTGVLKEYYYNIAYRPLQENGKITGMIQVAVDVTEQVTARKKLEESENRYRMLSETLEKQVAERTMELQRSNEDLQQFAHVASHDLKEPVRKIKTFAGRLEHHLEGSLDEPATKFMERINVATDRMFTMIDGVLAYSTTNATPQKMEQVNLTQIIKNIEVDLEVALHDSNGALVYGELPTVEGASVLLYQLFYNLINNSIKFAQAGVPPRIQLSGEVFPSEGIARIVLSDNGIGFDTAQAEKIFNTFARLHSKDEYEGTGLGLALCRKIAERHGGSITAAGEMGNGATFTITLPLHQTSNENQTALQ